MNKNFGESWEGKIQRIRENLGEGRYANTDGIFPIVKELVQNAEDAKAHKLLIVWSNGLPDAVHPLLRSPALLAINDGHFDADNGRAIREMGLSSKAADSSSIGKFGLGMKSVFHLSEVFFFVAHGDDGRQIDADLRNPWSADVEGLHADWDDLESTDIHGIAQHVKSLGWDSRWFCLWLPLRRQRDLNGIDPIEPFYPGDLAQGELLGSSQAEQLSMLMPMLSHLSRIELRVGQVIQAVQAEEFDTVRSARRIPLSNLADLPIGTTRTFEGQVSSQIGGTVNPRVYSGIEHRPDDAQLRTVAEHESWPKRFAVDKATGRSKQVPEKAHSHSAVCITAARSESAFGRLRLHWSVFLPLGAADEIQLAGCELSVDLFLHGWFFPNSGRTAVEGLQDECPPISELKDSSSVRRSWNHYLADCGTLPLLPTALAQFVEHSECDFKLTSAITRAIQHSTTFQRWHRGICRESSWFPRLMPDSRVHWQTVVSSSDYMEFPEVADSIQLSLIFTALPTLRGILDSHVVVPRGEPRLTVSLPTRWSTETIRQLLSNAAAEQIFAFPDLVAWLIRFLDNCAETDVWKQLGFELAGFARIGLRAVIANGSAQLVAETKKFLGRIPPTLRVNLAKSIGTDVIARELFEVMCQQPSDIVWIPQDCVPDHSPCSGTVAAKEAAAILKAFAIWGQRKLSPSARDTLGEFAAQTIAATSESQIQELLTIAGDCDLFPGTNCREQKEQSLSWNLIIEHQRQHTLFARPSPMAKQLQDALAEESIILIAPNIGRLLFGEDHEATKQCREGQLLAALSAIPKPRLTPPIQRRKLLDTLLGYSGGRAADEFKNCVRFVLHGDPDRFGVAEALLVRGAGCQDVWRRITNIALNTLGQQWRLLDSIFSGVLSDDHRREFGIELIGSTAAISLVKEVTNDSGAVAAFGVLCPTHDEYRELLQHIDDVELCKRLPIHESVGGEFVSIDEHSYWQSNWTLPDDLAAQVRLLKLSDDDKTQRRQRQLTDSLDAKSLVEIVLQHPNPSMYWEVIAEAIGSLTSIPENLASQLSLAAWMPTTSGDFIKPQDVIHLPELREGISHLTAANPGVYFDPESVAKELREHSAFDRILEQVVPPRTRALEMLGLVLLENPRNLVGEIDLQISDWLDSFSGASADLIPQLPLLRDISKKFPTTAHHAFDELRQPITEQRLHEYLSHLREEHDRERSRSRQDRLLRTYGKYLHTLLTPETCDESLKRIPLPARDGSWHFAEELCCENDGVAASAVVAAAIEQALGPFLPEAKNATERSVSMRDPLAPSVEVQNWDYAAAADRLRCYFDSWRDVIPNEQIGGFLALLGDEPSLRQLAQEFLGRNRTIETTREKFGLMEMPAGGHLEDGPEMISKQRVVIEIVDTPTVTVYNLFGRPITVSRNHRPKTLFVGYGNRNCFFPHRGRTRCFRLNAINPRDFTEMELAKLLRDSAVKFIGEAYNSYEQQTHFAATWDELAESDQLDIRITQSRIIEHGFLILDQYGLRSDPHLSSVLDQWDSAERLKAERETQAESAKRHSHRNPERELQSARTELRALLESAEHREMQQRILDAVRHRIANYYQYKSDSIPFELFQNADDAYAELTQVSPRAGEMNSTHERPTVILWREGNRLSFVHFGRRINQYPVGGDQLSRGFDNDLWKMSVLSLSNKGHTNGGMHAAVTGKFGLGFKSVFLACDRPRLLSGRLAFEFVGGVYPRRLIGEERRSLDVVRSSVGFGDSLATVIELEIKVGIDPKDVVGRFARLAHLLVVFGRKVRCCRLIEAGRHEENVFWDQSDDVPKNPGVQAGIIRPLSGLSPDVDASNVLLFMSDAGSLLFGLDARTFKRFADYAPTIWVTAPTEEQLNLGFLINGPFSLDVGRAQLARDPEQNRVAANRLGQRFGEQLEQLFETSQPISSWSEVRKSLNLAADTTSFEFWDSLWDLLVLGVATNTTRDEPADQLVRDILWDKPDQGAAGFYARKRAIPTRLPGARFVREMVSLSSVHYSIRGILSQDDGYSLACIRNWPQFQEKVGERQIVSHEKIVQPLRKYGLCPNLVAHITAIGLPEVLEWELGHRMVGVADANRFGELIDKQFLASLRDNIERDRLKDLLKPTEFLARNNRYLPASRLLVGHHPAGAPDNKYHDERRRAAFAPGDRVINPAYTATGVEFFDTCRERMDATAREMAGWVLEASEIGTQRAALEYLSTGESGRAIQQELRQRGLEGTWLARLSEHPAFVDMTSADKGGLLGLLPESVAERIVQAAIQNGPHAQMEWSDRSPTDILADISKWWQRERTRRLPDYEQLTYPQGGLRHLTDDSPENDRLRRKDWVTLFLIGLTHTMGRTVATQHRGFLRRCEQEGSLDMIADSERDPAQWLQWVDRFLNQQLDDSVFLQWMKQFVGIYQVSRHLDDYVEAFLAVDRIQRPFSLAQATNTRVSALFQRGGVDAPPLSRVLGMGQCFIMRELVRMNVIRDRHAYRHCFVPVARVRSLLQRLGCQGLDTPSRRWELSPVIHRFLSQHLGGDTAPFFPDFDIPLQIIAEDASLMAQFFATEIQFDGDDEPDTWESNESTAESMEAS